MDRKELESALEAILFASGEPVQVDRICVALDIDRPTVEQLLQKLMDYYAYERRGIRLLKIDDSWQLCSAPDYAETIRKAFEIRKQAKLSQPALEVLTIIAYYQPTTRAYVDQIRGVDSSYTVGLLLDRGLIEECGRLQVPGRPRQYRTTKQFLRAFHLSSLKDLPEGANMGLSCGNPLTIASLKEGQTVVDLGSGGGFDVFQAGRRVGKSGRAIGVDMTWEMLEKARHNIAVYRDTTGLDNVEFRLGEIEHLPVADASVDVVISNCVINLSPDKPQVWREVYRVLKKGGRAAVSDLHLLKPLPESIAGKVEAWVGCVAGAVLVDDTRSMLNEAGFSSVKLTPRTEYIRSMQSMEDPLYREIAEALPAGSDVSDYIVSLEISAVK